MITVSMPHLVDIGRNTTLCCMVKMSSVRSVESLLSRSVIGVDSVEVEPRSVVGAVSCDLRSLHITAQPTIVMMHCETHLLNTLPLPLVESLPR